MVYIHTFSSRVVAVFSEGLVCSSILAGTLVASVAGLLAVGKPPCLPCDEAA